MDRKQMEAMLGRGHRDVRIKGGHYASMAAKVIAPFNSEYYLIRLSNQKEFVALPEELEPAIPTGPDQFQEEQRRRREERAMPGPDLLREYNNPRQREVREAVVITMSVPVEDRDVFSKGLEQVGYVEGPPGTWKIPPKPTPKPTANAYTTIMGVVAWREADRKNRRIHLGLIDDSTDTVDVWVSTLKPRVEREHRFTKHHPAADVPAILDGLMMSSELHDLFA
jgi:hypothetical protein